jgi:hypothetical protein
VREHHQIGGSTITTTLNCGRCGREAFPTSDELSTWEILPPDVVCEDCVTPAEFEAIADNLQATVDETRLRRKADRRGLQLMKSRRRDPAATGYGTYMLVDSKTRKVVASGLPEGYGLDLDDVKRYLIGPGSQRRVLAED